MAKTIFYRLIVIMGLYTLVEKYNNPTFVSYIGIILFMIVVFRSFPIGLNIILGIVFAVMVIAYYTERNELEILNEDSERKAKIENITPKLHENAEFDDVISLVFSIQDFYDYNPQAFEEMIDNINNFFEIYDILKKGYFHCEYMYQIADSKKNNANNALQSMIYTLPVSPEVTEKLDRAHKRLETILLEYLNKMHDICHHDKTVNGRHIFRKELDLGPRASNHYFDKDFTYQFY